MATDFHALLVSAGLLPSEAKVYIAGRELGPSTAQHIAEKAKISRTATYEALELLKGRGLFSASSTGKKNLFVAEDPERLVSHLKNEEQRIQTTLKDVARSVDALRLLSGGIQPIMRVYEGDEALKAYFDHVASVNPKEWLEMTNADDIHKYIDPEMLAFARKSIEKIPPHRLQVIYRGVGKSLKKGVRFAKMDSSFGEFHGNIAIYEKYIAFVTYIGKSIVVIIESKALAETMRVMFKAAWAASEEHSA